jgi:hypothetical protein
MVIGRGMPARRAQLHASEDRRSGWAEIRRAAANQSIYKRGNLVAQEAAAFGLSNGLIMPIHGYGDLPAAVSYGGHDLDLSDDALAFVDDPPVCPPHQWVKPPQTLNNRLQQSDQRIIAPHVHQFMAPASRQSPSGGTSASRCLAARLRAAQGYDARRVSAVSGTRSAK